MPSPKIPVREIKRLFKLYQSGSKNMQQKFEVVWHAFHIWMKAQFGDNLPEEEYKKQLINFEPLKAIYDPLFIGEVKKHLIRLDILFEKISYDWYWELYPQSLYWGGIVTFLYNVKDYEKMKSFAQYVDKNSKRIRFLMDPHYFTFVVYDVAGQLLYLTLNSYLKTSKKTHPSPHKANHPKS